MRRLPRAFRIVCCKVSSFLSCSGADQLLLFQVFVLLGFARAAILVLPYSRLERFLGLRMVETSKEASECDLTQARRIAWAVAVVRRVTPWRSNCFPQALAAKVLLRFRGVPTTLYTGSAFSPGDGDSLKGHVWLRCGPFFVTGGDGSERFGAIAAFGE